MPFGKITTSLSFQIGNGGYISPIPKWGDKEREGDRSITARLNPAWVSYQITTVNFAKITVLFKGYFGTRLPLATECYVCATVQGSAQHFEAAT